MQSMKQKGPTCKAVNMQQSVTWRRNVHASVTSYEDESKTKKKDHNDRHESPGCSQNYLKKNKILIYSKCRLDLEIRGPHILTTICASEMKLCLYNAYVL